MIRAASLVFATSLVLTTAVDAAYRIEVTVNIGGGRWQVTSDATTTLLDSSNTIQYSAYIGHRHSLYSTNRILNEYPNGFGKIQSFLTNTAATGSPLPDGCNYAEIIGQSVDGEFPAPSQSKRTTNLCWSSTPPPKPPSDTPVPWDSCDGGTCYGSPIVINRHAGSYKLSSVDDDPVVFDLDADGRPDTTAWTARNSNLDFLALDRNDNSRIDDGSELFGDATPIGQGRAVNGFEALRQYDQNRDGVIDSRDATWNRLLLWQDMNHNGLSESVELIFLSTSGIKALTLDYHWTGRLDASGNALRYEGKLEDAQGRKSYYDVFFRVRN